MRRFYARAREYHESRGVGHVQASLVAGILVAMLGLTSVVLVTVGVTAIFGRDHVRNGLPVGVGSIVAGLLTGSVVLSDFPPERERRTSIAIAVGGTAAAVVTAAFSLAVAFVLAIATAVAAYVSVLASQRRTGGLG